MAIKHWIHYDTLKRNTYVDSMMASHVAIDVSHSIVTFMDKNC